METYKLGLIEGLTDEAIIHIIPTKNYKIIEVIIGKKYLFSQNNNDVSRAQKQFNVEKY